MIECEQGRSWVEGREAKNERLSREEGWIREGLNWRGTRRWGAQGERAKWGLLMLKLAGEAAKWITWWRANEKRCERQENKSIGVAEVRTWFWMWRAADKEEEPRGSVLVRSCDIISNCLLCLPQVKTLTTDSSWPSYSHSSLYQKDWCIFGDRRMHLSLNFDSNKGRK